MVHSLPKLRFSTTAASCRARTAESLLCVSPATDRLGTPGTARQPRRGGRTSTPSLAPGDAVTHFLPTTSHGNYYPQSTNEQANALQASVARAPRRRGAPARFRDRRRSARDLCGHALDAPLHRRHEHPAVTSRDAGIAKVHVRVLAGAARRFIQTPGRAARQVLVRGTGPQRPRARATLIFVSRLTWGADRPSHHTGRRSFPLAAMPTTTLRPAVSLDILVPVTDDEGVPFPDSLFATFEHHVVDLTGGITRRGDVEGIWRRPDGSFQRERSRSYTTTADTVVAEWIARTIDRLIRTRSGNSPRTSTPHEPRRRCSR